MNISNLFVVHSTYVYDRIMNVYMYGKLISFFYIPNVSKVKLKISSLHDFCFKHYTALIGIIVYILVLICQVKHYSFRKLIDFRRRPRVVQDNCLYTMNPVRPDVLLWLLISV